MSGNRKETTSARPPIEEPPYLAVGTEVSAKYRGAFCEANIKSVKKLVKCKVNFENGGGNSTVTDDCVIGKLKVGSDVKVKVPDGEDMAGTLVKITDSSSYTVVFDDGDERTLKRTSLCIKGEKHFNESETLDHLPLTDPENFGTPVVQQGKKSRKGRRSSLSLDDSKDDEEMPARKKLDIKKEENVDKVVMIEVTEKKKTFLLPSLLLSSTDSQSEVKSPENVLVRSFKDGKHIEVHPKDVKDFSKESILNSTLAKGGNPAIKSAVELAVKYIETKQLPSDWDEEKPGDLEKNESSDNSSESEPESDGDENDRSEFLQKLNKFLGEKGTPLLRSPVLGHRDLDLYKLFKIVSKMDGMDKVESWYTVYKKMNIPIITTTACYHIKNAYKRYLYDYEVHAREESKEEKTKKPDKPSDGSTSKNTANEEDETPVGSDSEKDLKELLQLSEDEKLLSQRSANAKKGRAKRKTRTNRSKSLRSPSSPGLSPLSPSSPKSISSISASESTGCPSPAENYCNVRGKIDLALGKSSEKSSTDGDDLRDRKCDLPSKEIDSKDNFNSKTKKENKIYKESELVVKLENLANVEMSKTNVERSKENGGKTVDDSTNIAESTGKKDALSKENEKLECKNSEKESNIKKNIKNEENLKDEKNIQDGGSHVDEGGGEDSDDSGDKTVAMDTETDNQGQEGTDVEDAVDVVNSPSSTSDTVDSDDRNERKTDKKGKRKGEGKTGAKNDDVSDSPDGLEYKLNERIDVRYGRGRNATIYHAKITCVDPNAEEGLVYLVHYQGWNARHDEWIGHERIIGRGVKQTRTRTIKEPSKSLKPAAKPPKQAPKPTPTTKKNGKNGAGHVKPSVGVKARKRTPSPTTNAGTSGRNGNGRACKNRKDNASEKTESSSEVKFPARVTRRNSLTLPLDTSDQDFLDQKSPDSKADSEKESVPSPPRAQRSASQHAKSPSPKRHLEKTSDSAASTEQKLGNVNSGENTANEKNGDAGQEGTVDKEASAMDVDSKDDEGKSLKRPRDDETETSSLDSPPSKKKPEDKDSSAEDVFETAPERSSKETNESEATADDASGPDLTCSEQLPTNCASPDPYTADFPESRPFYRNGVVAGAESGNGSKEKDSSSSLDEAKVEKPVTSRKTKCRRDRKARAPSSQSSVDTVECPNGTTNGPTVTVMLSPSWTPRYNFTEDLDELLKNEESSERIRLLTEKIKDIRKVYGELKSEVANIDRKRKRRQKRKREEELSNEENATRSPSRSSPLTTTSAVSSANSMAAVECR